MEEDLLLTQDYLFKDEIGYQGTGYTADDC